MPPTPEMSRLKHLVSYNNMYRREGSVPSKMVEAEVLVAHNQHACRNTKAGSGCSGLKRARSTAALLDVTQPVRPRQEMNRGVQLDVNQLQAMMNHMQGQQRDPCPNMEVFPSQLAGGRRLSRRATNLAPRRL